MSAIQSTGGGPLFLATTWHGGCRNAEADFAGRILAPNNITAVFHHDVRVRRLPDGSAEAWFYEDSYPSEANGRWSNVNIPNPKWRRLTHQGIASALLKQAELEQSHPVPIP